MVDPAKETQICLYFCFDCRLISCLVCRSQGAGGCFIENHSTGQTAGRGTQFRARRR